MQSRLLVGQVDRIVALDKEPVLRNLLITQCYHDLSSEVARVLGAGNVNWCSFATWASKTAGRFIRGDEVPSVFRKVLEDSHGFRKGVQRLGNDLVGLHAETALGELDMFGVAERIVGSVSDQIIAGNLKVFSELAPVFARFIEAFDGNGLDERKADRLLGSLREGPSSRDGQSLLRESLEHLLDAARESDPTRKAQLILVSNAQTGLHEQIRLQPYIAGSLNAPIDDTLGEIWCEHGTKNVAHSLFGRIHALWDRLGAPLVQEVTEAWRRFSAVELMTLAVPGQVLHLGSPLPAIPGKPLYPAALSEIDNAAALQLLEQYDALDPGAEGYVGASDWTLLAQRMRYILALFRSRQQEPSILQQPFSQEQLGAILGGKIPNGPLS